MNMVTSSFAFPASVCSQIHGRYNRPIREIMEQNPIPETSYAGEEEEEEEKNRGNKSILIKNKRYTTTCNTTFNTAEETTTHQSGRIQSMHTCSNRVHVFTPPPRTTTFAPRESLSGSTVYDRMKKLEGEYDGSIKLNKGHVTSSGVFHCNRT